MSEPSSLPDNLKSRVGRIYVSENSFVDKQTNETIKYKRVCLDVTVNGKPQVLSFKPEKSDLLLLELADVIPEAL